MGFFDDVDHGDSFELGGSSVIPDNTQVLAVIESAEWKEFSGERYINLQWSVLEPDTYKNRKVFQKLKINDPKKKEKHLQMLAAIDKNAGGKLLAANEEPTDAALNAALVMAQMVIRVKVWEMNGNEGNWVSMVSPKTAIAEADTDVPF